MLAKPLPTVRVKLVVDQRGQLLPVVGDTGKVIEGVTSCQLISEPNKRPKLVIEMIAFDLDAGSVRPTK